MPLVSVSEDRSRPTFDLDSRLLKGESLSKILEDFLVYQRSHFIFEPQDKATLFILEVRLRELLAHLKFGYGYTISCCVFNDYSFLELPNGAVQVTYRGRDFISRHEVTYKKKYSFKGCLLPVLVKDELRRGLTSVIYSEPRSALVYNVVFNLL